MNERNRAENNPALNLTKSNNDAGHAARTQSITTQQTKWSQFGVLISVFFFWGFVAASNDILIPVFKENLHLEQWQSQMISFAFYVAYTVGSIIYLLVSKAIGGDILNRIGYKNGIALGLVISALGTL